MEPRRNHMLATTGTSHSHKQMHEPKSPTTTTKNTTTTTTTTADSTTTTTANNLPPPDAHHLHHRSLDSRDRDIASLHPTSSSTSTTSPSSSSHPTALPRIGDVTDSPTTTDHHLASSHHRQHQRQHQQQSVDRQSLPPPSYSLAERPAAAIDPPTAHGLGSVDRQPPRRSSHDDHERSRNNSLVLPSLSSITGGPLPRPDNMMLNQQPAPSVPQWPHASSMTSSQHSSPPSFSQIQSRSQSQSRSPLPPPPPAAHTQRFDSPATMDLDTISNSGISAPSPGRASSVSLDDPDVRLAAEALGDLRADFLSSPPSSNAVLPLSPPSIPQPVAAPHGSSRSSNQEPLFSLLTTSHPLLATTIEGASSAYGGAKNFSPRFKSSAEYVEGYLTPIANTVGSVGRVTGVEGGVRWFLGAGRRQTTASSDQEVEGNSKKRRKFDSEMEATSNKRLESASASTTGTLTDSSPSTPKGDRRLSMASTIDTLPAYDEMRSPAYTETSDVQKPTVSNAAWQSRLIMSTSGLSVAMSSESLRSLKFCLQWLRWANDHMAHVIEALKNTLEQYEQAENPEMANAGDLESQSKVQDQTMTDASGEAGSGSLEKQPQQPAQSRGELAARINSLKGDVVKTLQDVINNVSKYAGGALPENAKILVRRHLTSLPQRFRVATMSQPADPTAEGSESAMREGAQKVLVLAKEGLDMVVQVSGVVDGTIVSAEEWLDRMGKKRPDKEQDKDRELVLPQIEDRSPDVKMG